MPTPCRPHVSTSAPPNGHFEMNRSENPNMVDDCVHTQISAWTLSASSPASSPLFWVSQKFINPAKSPGPRSLAGRWKQENMWQTSYTFCNSWWRLSGNIYQVLRQIFRTGFGLGIPASDFMDFLAFPPRPPQKSILYQAWPARRCPCERLVATWSQSDTCLLHSQHWGSRTIPVTRKWSFPNDWRPTSGMPF